MKGDRCVFQVVVRPTVLAASCLLASCVIIPIGGGEPHPFGKERLDFVEIGVTHKNDVRSELGRPRIRHGGKWWMYRGTRKESDWLVIAGGGYMADAEKLEGGTSSYRLLIGFQADSTVWRYGVLKEDSRCDTHRGLCYQDGKVYVSVEPDEMPIDDPNCGVEFKVGNEVSQGCIYALD